MHVQAKHADPKEISLSGAEVRRKTDEILDSEDFIDLSIDFREELRCVIRCLHSQRLK